MRLAEVILGDRLQHIPIRIANTSQQPLIRFEAWRSPDHRLHTDAHCCMLFSNSGDSLSEINSNVIT